MTGADRMRTILFGCANYWSSPIQVGDHHLARQFVRDGWSAAFISHPLTPLHALRRGDDDRRARWDIYRSGGVRDEDGRLWGYVPGALVAPFGRGVLASRWVLRSWHRLTWPRLVARTRREGFGDLDVVYLRDVRQAFWLDVVPHRRSVYRIADNDAGFRSRTPALAEAEAAVARRVDLVVYTARTLEPYVRRLGPRRMEYLPNGVNYDHFAREDLPRPPEYATIPGPIVVYVGSLEEWFDFELVADCAEAMPEVSFVLIGPTGHAAGRLPRRRNLHLLGPRPYADAPTYMYHAAAGMVPFAVHRNPTLVNAVNPLKIYEYFASGIPVVATSWEELRALDAPLHLAGGTDAFIRALRDVLATGADRTSLRRHAAPLDWRAIYTRLRGFLDLDR